MAIDLKTLGSKLAKYRGQLEESVIEVASATGIDAARLTAIEAGQVEPTGDDILILADHYRCDFKFFISNEQVAPFEQTETLYRAHGNDFTKEDRRAVQDFLYLCETEDFLMRELGRQTTIFDFSPSGEYFKGHGEAAAASLRAALGHEDRAVPRDVYAESCACLLRRRSIPNFPRASIQPNASARPTSWSLVYRTSM
ncbi:MAG: helix-turn-helix transcriptional regulator [Alphaproteobacteria bacterium]|nr:helix-turn-helix transcriptional regulator [Alphaproteobacteria bacterium]